MVNVHFSCSLGSFLINSNLLYRILHPQKSKILKSTPKYQTESPGTPFTPNHSECNEKNSTKHSIFLQHDATAILKYNNVNFFSLTRIMNPLSHGTRGNYSLSVLYKDEDVEDLIAL